ncbi:MAG: CopD family protein [Granulosicoccus sp.]
MNSIAIAVHALAATVWIGGLFFAYVVLRPSAAELDPPPRLVLWAGVFRRFFPWAWMSVLLLLTSGYWLLFSAFGGFASSPVYVHIMQLLGLTMIALFAWLFHRPYKVFKQAVARQEWPDAGAALGKIRSIVGLNVILGVVMVIMVAAGRYGFQ